MIFIKLRQIPSVAHDIVSSLHQLAPRFPSQNMMVSNQLKLSFTFILLLQILINSVVFVFVFEDIVLIFIKMNQYTYLPIYHYTNIPTYQSLCLFVCWGPWGQEPSRFVILRLEICGDRWDRQSCKIFPNCVKFWGNNANSLGNYRVIYVLNE